MNTKNAIILIMAGIIAALIIFNKGCKDPAKPALVPTKIIVQTVEADKASTIKTVDSLYKIIAAKQASTNASTAKIPVLQKKARAIEKVLIEANKDTTAKDYFNALELVSNSVERDTACNESIRNLNDMLTLKDAVITAKNSGFNKLNASFNLLADQNSKLELYTHQLQRQVKRKKFGLFIWKAAAVAGGLFILKNAIH